MRYALIIALALVACSKPEAPPAPDAPVVIDAPAPFIPITGTFSATSTTAMGITGDLTVTDARLSFGKGFMLNTAPATAIDITTLTHKDGDSFAATMTAPTSLAIELRGVTGVIRAADTRVQPLCGPDAPTFVALAYDTPTTAVSMAVFSGPYAPGPEAVNSTLCGTFRYDK